MKTIGTFNFFMCMCMLVFLYVCLCMHVCMRVCARTCAQRQTLGTFCNTFPSHCFLRHGLPLNLELDDLARLADQSQGSSCPCLSAQIVFAFFFSVCFGDLTQALIILTQIFYQLSNLPSSTENFLTVLGCSSLSAVSFFPNLGHIYEAKGGISFTVACGISMGSFDKIVP